MILEIVTRDIERLYDQKGFLFADVKAQKRATAEGIDLTIRVIEGPRVAVEDIKIVGNKHLTAKQLRRIIRTKSSGFIRNRYIDREVLDQDVIAIRNWYRAEGYRDVKVNLGDVWFNQSRRRASITIFVEEGVRYQVRDIRFEGNTLFTEEELRSSIGMTSGEFLVDRFVARDRQRIQVGDPHVFVDLMDAGVDRPDLDDLRARGVTFAQHHAGNSAATVVFGRAFPFGYARPGLALYGNGVGDGLHQTMRLVTEVGALREIPAGDAVSYGFAWRAKRPSLVAVLPIGYADGYPRRVSNRAEVLVRGRRCPVVGKVCMDMTLVDVTDIADQTQVGDPVVALGDQANDRISTAEFAEWAGLTEYEVTCGISKRVPRVYRGAEESS